MVLLRKFFIGPPWIFLYSSLPPGGMKTPSCVTVRRMSSRVMTSATLVSSSVTSGRIVRPGKMSETVVSSALPVRTGLAVTMVAQSSHLDPHNPRCGFIITSRKSPPKHYCHSYSCTYTSWYLFVYYLFNCLFNYFYFVVLCKPIYS